jgi:hypothetical protein
VQDVFNYLLCLLMVEAGVMRLVETVTGEPVPWPAWRSQDGPGNGTLCVFETAAGDRFSVVRPATSEEQEAIVVEREMVEAIVSFIVEKVLDILPRSIARCFISPLKIASKVEIDLRREHPIDINFGSEIPRLSLSFRISNLSPVDLVLDRLLIDLWFRQPTLRGAILERYGVRRNSSRDDVYFTDQLTVSQQEQIRRHVDGKLLSVPVTIHIKAYFDSRIGSVCVEKRLEHGDVPCELPPTVTTKSQS